MKSPTDWFEEEVLPPYRIFAADPTSSWKARAAVIALRHFPERVFPYYEKSDPTQIGHAPTLAAFTTQLHATCPDLELLRDVADASKHQFPDDRTPKKRVVVTATDAISVSPKGLVVAPSGRRILDLVWNCVEFWQSWLANRSSTLSP